ncbi:GGDEF domain-containing protein [Tumebacillus lipolyticus]|uniref:GGDEF domain-containing protein n=1 Tax=Tumebacillus lipolyticus TaxID=1280370 RepID=A0ABW5A1Y3_9BACL
MAIFFRFLMNHKALLITLRTIITFILLPFAWQPYTDSFDPIMLSAFGYYLFTTGAMFFIYGKGKHRWKLWQLLPLADLAVVSVMVYDQGGLQSDLYYAYFALLAMVSFLYKCRAAIWYTLAVNASYLTVLLLAPSAVSIGDVAVRMVFFSLLSLVFLMLSLMETRHLESSSESMKLVHENEQLVMEMESISRQVAEYTFDLHNKAVLDQLTHLHNHSYLHSQLVIEIEKAKQNEEPLSLVMFDIDNFKRVNDTFGHLVGDEALRIIAKRMKDLLQGTYYTPCRSGGEELAVIMPDASLEDAYAMAEFLRIEISKVKIPLANGEFLRITTSVGVSSFPETSHNHQHLIDCADKAMYVAKTSGKNRTCRYNLTLEENHTAG